MAGGIGRLGQARSALASSLRAATGAPVALVRSVSRHHNQWQVDKLLRTPGPVDDLERYFGTAQSLQGAALIDHLGAVTANGQRELTYNYARDAMFRFVDRDTSNAITDVYSGVKYLGIDGRKSAFQKGINTEHVWPHHWGAEGMAHNDLHIIRPSDIGLNEHRWHLPFGEVVGEAVWTSKPSSATGEVNRVGLDALGRMVFEPIPSARGELARIEAYFFTRYNHQRPKNFAVEHFGESLPTLLKWHREHPVTARETARDAAVARIQFNHNPFVHKPEWMDQLPQSAELRGAPRRRTPAESQAEIADWQSFIKDPEGYYRRKKAPGPARH